MNPIRTIFSLAFGATLLLACAPQNCRLSPDGQSVIDTANNTMWTRCFAGQHYDPAKNRCVGQAWQLNWQEAQQAVKRLSHGGHDDWRLPHKHELQQLVYCSSGDPAPAGMPRPYTACTGEFHRPVLSPEHFAVRTTWGIWSAHEHGGYPGSAWYLHLFSGFIGHYDKTKRFYLLPLRSTVL